MLNKLNKQIGLIVCALVIVMMVLAGCGSTSSSDASSVDSTKAATSAESAKSDKSETEKSEEKSGTRKVTTVMGEVEVPVNPQRVIVNWYVGDVFTLGIKPVAINARADKTMPFYDQFEGIPITEKWESEEILKYEPDLIITYDPKDYEDFSKLAPVIVVPEGEVSSSERLSFLGAATGHEAEAKEAIAVFEEKLQNAKGKLSSGIFKDKNFSILQDWGRESYGVMYETGSRGGTLLYEYIGLKKPEKLEQLVKKSGKGRDSLSYEVASQYFGDYVLWFLKEGYESEYAKSVIWNSIPAVKQGNVIQIPGEYSGLFYYSDVASMTAQLDYILDRLLALEKK
ncbi:ABC transporter substrate-binding protein [Paenibacillus sp. UMB4589-SE434]|uniref:ABC transporter substrate-binding protein n=1 Tax=Paenibacillus sp. UMB4589-SE434 TaxID=3046314 RepID=UPI002550A7C1|nr:ABC transporter substrate-binding protein [Paenibacillus sp. UMB4589-SE434]MDK8179959.1 ABC transporter substrate-binding protein [Paenibacillus sp. UMB4589-SE434]